MALLNQELRHTLAEQQQTATRLRDSEQRLRLAHEALQATNDSLEERVAERTAELARKRALLQTAHERLALATDGCGIGIWDWDVTSGQMFWDARMFTLYGVSAGQVMADVEQWRGAIHKDDLAATEQALQDALAGKRLFDPEFRVVWPDGSVHHIHSAGRVERDADGRPTRMVGINWDVTERHSAEAMRISRDEADRASRAKSDFLATMSHEIRSPLSGLIGLLESLRATDLDAEQRQMVAMAGESGSHLLAVLNDILDFSKIEAGQMSIHPQPCEVRALAVDLVEPHRPSATRRNLHLDLHLDPGLPHSILVDKLRLRQIVGNLVSNALKFTASGGITVDIARDPSASPATLRLAVRDTGIGMTQEVLGRLFRPFQQGDGSTTRTYGGTGLGLSISQKLAQMQGGSITVTSIVNAGSEFVLHLPLQACLAENPVGVPLPAPPPDGEWSGSGLRVLVVEDDPTIRFITLRKLKKLGLGCEQAVDGAAGLARLQSERFDLILTDCHMPNMDGVELTKAVRGSADPALRNLPVLGLTADVTEAMRLRCTEVGMTHLAIKPITIEALSNLLRSHLQLHAA